MTRRVFFSFRYKHVFRVNQIRNIPAITGVAVAGFKDASLWETVKGNGSEVKRMIDRHLQGTSVTVVCITHGIKDRQWINYEIDQSLERGNGLLGIHLNDVPDPANPADSRRGAVPDQFKENGLVRVYQDVDTLAQQIEQVAKQAGR